MNSSNPYNIQVADFSQGLQGLTGAIAQRGQFERQKAKETANLKMRENVFNLMKEGTPEEIEEYVVKNPGAKQVFDEVIGITNDITKQDKVDTALKILTGEDPAQAMLEHAEVIDQQGGDASQTIETIKQTAVNPEVARKGALKILAAYAPDKLKAFQSLKGASDSKTTSIKEYEYALDNPGFAASQKAKADAKKTKEVGVQNFKDEQSLRKEYSKQSAEYVKVRDSYTRVKGSTEDPSPAGDLSLIFNYMKMLDPGSVVRESEFATAAQTGSYGDRIQASVQKVMSGERLTNKQRKDFVDKAGVLMKGMKKQHKKREKSYIGIAKKNNLDPKQVVMDIDVPVENPFQSIDTKAFKDVPIGTILNTPHGDARWDGTKLIKVGE